MKYKDTTEEQRKSITPILRKWFEEVYEYGSFEDICRDERIEGFQEAQKKEIKDLIKLQGGVNYILEGNKLIAKLKFESELE